MSIQVLEDLEVLVNLLTTRACEAELQAQQLQQSVTSLQTACDRTNKEHAAASQARQALESDAVKHKKVLCCLWPHFRHTNTGCCSQVHAVTAV